MHRRDGPGRPPYPDVLTPAEWQTVEGVRHGLTNKQIASRLGVSADAIKYHVANALNKLGFPSRFELRHWDGIPRSSPLCTRETIVNPNLRLGQIAQVSRVVSDVQAAVAWYRDMLGLELLYTFAEFAFFDCAGMRLYLSQGDASRTQESILYFRVDDIHSAHDTLAARGVQFANAPHLIHRHPDGTEEWLAAFNDPDGRPLQLMSQVKSAKEQSA